MSRELVEDVLEGIDLKKLDLKKLNELFPRTVDGKPNPDIVRAHVYIIESLVLKVSTGQIPRMPQGANAAQLRALIRDIAKLAYGMDEKRIVDTRSEAEIFADALKDLKQTPEKWFEESEGVFATMEAAMDTIEEDAEAQITKYIDEETRELCLGKQGRIRRIRKSIQRVRKLRRRASKPIWNPKAEPVRKAAQEATHVWRHIAYIRRSGLAHDGDHPKEGIIDLGPHHAKMAVDVWEAENGVDWLPDEDQHGNYVDGSKVLPRKGRIQCHGCIVICPPAHSKTEFAQGWVTTRISKNRKTQGAYLGETDDLAHKSLQYIGAAFTLDDAAGRRNATLYPNLEIDGKISTKQFRVKVDSRKKTPTLTASGAMSGMQGVDHDFQVHDDVVPQSDADSETERERRKRRLMGTTKMRLRGNRHFTLVVCTLWHEHDANSTLMKRAKAAKADYRISKQVVGGPTTTPKFFAIWSKIGPQALKRKFETEMNGDIRLWSATHQANPRPIESRIVRRVRLYDINDEQHTRFLKSGPVRWVSIDPSFVMRKGADKTGFIYAAIGDVSWYEEDAFDNKVRHVERRLRVLKAEEFQANAAVVAARLQGFALGEMVDRVAIEAEGGGIVTADWVEKECGAPVERVRTRNMDKEHRLRRTARFLEDQTQEWSIARACVEFPAERDEHGNLKVVEHMKRLVEEIVDFGVCSHDHLLDGLTQLLTRLASELAPGTGEWSEAVQEAIEDDMPLRDPRKERMLRLFGTDPQERPGMTATEEDWKFALDKRGDW